METKKVNTSLKIVFIVITIVAIGGLFGTYYFYNQSYNQVKCANDNSNSQMENLNKTNDSTNKDVAELEYNYFKLVTDTRKSNMLDGLLNLNVYLQFATYLPNNYSINNVTNDTIESVIADYINTFGYQKPNDEMETIDGLGYYHIIIEKDKVDYFIKKYFNLDNYTIPNYLTEFENNGIKYYQKLVAGFGTDSYSYLTVIDKKYNSDGTITVYVNKYDVEYIDTTVTKIELILNSNYVIQNVKYVS